MFDFPAIIRLSRSFYTAHGLEDWAQAVPPRPAPSRDVESLLEQADRGGFHEGFAFPPYPVQKAALPRVVDHCARVHATQLPDNLQYREPFLADTWTKIANGKFLQRDDDLGERIDGPYVLLLAPRPIANCWGKTGRQIAEQFQAKGWRGLTVPEYLVLQRAFAERHGDHRFFNEPEDPTAHLLWLIDSMTDTECSVAWGGVRGINLQATGVNNRESKRAAVAGVIVPITEA